MADNSTQEEQDVLGLLANRPMESLDVNHDLFYLGTRANAIKNFINNTLLKKVNSDVEFKYNISIIGLFGDWGSGKTSVINEVIADSENNNKKYKTIRFPAWEYEQSSDIALAFLDFLLEHTHSASGLNRKKILMNAYEVFKGVAQDTQINLPFVSIKPEKSLRKVEELRKERGFDSYHQKKKKLEDNYKEIVEDILNPGNEKKYEKLIVFIDDLDRCEPENILKMISSLKLFFSGKENQKLSVAHFIAIDEIAIKQAIRTKYKDEIKAEEYLEKIIDINFNLPKFYDTNPIIRNVFDQIGLKSYSDIAVRMLRALQLTNPRKVKKILSKLYLLINDTPEDKLKPKFFDVQKQKEKRGDENKTPYLYDFVVFFFLLIIHELSPEEYNTFYDLKGRGEYFDKIFKKHNRTNLDITPNIDSMNHILTHYTERKSISLKEIYSLITPFIFKKLINKEKAYELINDTELKAYRFQKMMFIVPFLPDDIRVFEDQDYEVNKPDFKDGSKAAPEELPLSGDKRRMKDHIDEAMETNTNEFIVKYLGNSRQRNLYLFCLFLAENILEIISNDIAMENNNYEFHNFLDFLDKYA